MAGTDPLTGVAYPVTTDAFKPEADIQRAVNGLSSNAIPSFSSASARDAAFSAWVAQGNTMRDGLHCYVQSIGDQVYINGVWSNSWNTITPAANVAPYIGSGGVVTSGPYENFGYRVEGSRVFLRGWLQTTGTVAAGTALTAAMPTNVRPAHGQTIWPAFEVTGSQGGSIRCEVFTDGKIYTNRGMANGLFFSFDSLSYPI